MTINSLDIVEVKWKYIRNEKGRTLFFNDSKKVPRKRRLTTSSLMSSSSYFPSCNCFAIHIVWSVSICRRLLDCQRNPSIMTPHDILRHKIFIIICVLVKPFSSWICFVHSWHALLDRSDSVQDWHLLPSSMNVSLPDNALRTVRRAPSPAVLQVTFKRLTSDRTSLTRHGLKVIQYIIWWCPAVSSM